MIHRLSLVIPLLLMACPTVAEPPADPAQAEAAPAGEGPVTRQTATRSSPLLDFEYSWPQDVSAEAALVAYFRDDLSKNYDEALENARENKQQMEKAGGPFHQNQFARMWALAGETKRLMSLVANTNTYAGGAHPNHTSSALLWDRAANRPIELAELFQASRAFEAAVRPQFCKLLDAERAKRRQGETLDGFSECPPLSELTIAPAASDGSGPFDRIQLIADPYVAGPYVEGDYEVFVPISAGLIEALKPEFSDGFAAQPPQ